MAIRDSLALTEDQRALQDTLRGFLTDQLPPAVLRGTLERDPGYSPELHARLAREMGLAGLTIPKKFGGLGLSQAEACVVHAELGRALYPGPFLASCLAATALLAADVHEIAGAHEAAGHWLRLLADGSVIGTIAAADKDGRWSSGPGSVRAHLTSRGWRLYGRCWYVVAAHVAGIIAVPAVAGTVPAMFLVEAGAPGLTVSGQPGPDLTRRVCVTAFEATPAALIGQGDAAAAALARAERELLLATAAEAVGGVGWCLDAAVVAGAAGVGSEPAPGFFKAVARTCADMLEAFQSAEAAARYAAVADADGAPEAPAAALMAALTAGQAYRAVTEAAVHLFGGAGFAGERDTRLYYRRSWAAERLSGGPRAHRAALADLVWRSSLDGDRRNTQWRT